MLCERGFEVTQATLSRDLAQLRARRVSLPDGGTVYELDDVRGLRRRRRSSSALRELVTARERERGAGGGAHAAGRRLGGGACRSTARACPDVLGTIAGDDTIFVAPARRASAAARWPSC